MRRAHPANVVGWLFIPREEYGRAMDQQLRFRDEELSKDRSFSGEPPAFTSWALAHVTSLAQSDPSIVKQLTDRAAKLEEDLQKLEAERTNQLKCFEAKEAALTGEIETVLSLLPLPE